jgi:hypothetical protein
MPAGDRRVADERCEAMVDLDRRAVARGAAVGTVLIVIITIAGAIIDRSVDDFDDTGWPVTIFLAILVAYAVAGLWAGRVTTMGPLTTGALAGLGAFAVWVPIRILIWAVRDDSRGLFSGDDAVFSLGGVFANLVFAATLGMVGALVGVRQTTREVES